MKQCPGERMAQGNTSCRLLCFRIGILGQTSWRGGAQGYQAGKVPGQVMFLRGACTCPAGSALISRICCSSASLFQLQSSPQHLLLFGSLLLSFSPLQALLPVQGAPAS